MPVDNEQIHYAILEQIEKCRHASLRNFRKGKTTTWMTAGMRDAFVAGCPLPMVTMSAAEALKYPPAIGGSLLVIAPGEGMEAVTTSDRTLLTRA